MSIYALNAWLVAILFARFTDSKAGAEAPGEGPEIYCSTTPYRCMFLSELRLIADRELRPGDLSIHLAHRPVQQQSEHFRAAGSGYMLRNVGYDRAVRRWVGVL